MTRHDDPPLIRRIRESVIGDDQLIWGPYGPRRVTYADYIASGRSLTFIEDFIRDVVLPRYANTHTESSGTGLQTTRLREDAREIIRRAVGGDDSTAIIFAGSGSTGAIDKLIGILGIRIPTPLDDRHALSTHIPPNERPVVFIGPYEHHSNELPWRESVADVVVIPEDTDGHIDIGRLDEELAKYADRPLRIGSFSAASNVTGILTDIRAVAGLLHRHHALSFWDFAAAGPYVDIDMAANNLDAVFLSPHKFVGGPGTPGVLAVRKNLLDNRVPTVPGGGTVDYVNAYEHRYVTDPVHREEGGTPAIIESIRAGLVFQLKLAVGTEVIRAREAHFLGEAITAWQANPAIEILGNLNAERLSILSFVIRRPGGRYLHHNFVVSLLNDLFGIQCRGGCSCAGPYGHRLLGIDLEHSRRFEREIVAGCSGIKPGWVRVSFNYFLSDAVFRYLVDAIDLVATYGARLLPDYRFDPSTGLWRHRNGLVEQPLRLTQVGYDAAGNLRWPTWNERTIQTERVGHTGRPGQTERAGEEVLAEHLEWARATLTRLPDAPGTAQAAATERRTEDVHPAGEAIGTAPGVGVSPGFDELRWFELPEVCLRPGEAQPQWPRIRQGWEMPGANPAVGAAPGHLGPAASDAGRVKSRDEPGDPDV